MKKISVAITTYNRSMKLKRAIESVIRQSYAYFEIIVLDDCSTDNTKDIVTSIMDNRIHYYCNEINLGPRKNIRKVIDFCTGDYIIFLNDDDYYTDIDFFLNSISVLKDDIKMLCASAVIYNAYEDSYKDVIVFTDGIVEGVDYIRGYLTKYEKPVSTFTSIISLGKFKSSRFMDLNELDDNLILLIGLSFGKVYMSQKTVGIYRFGDNSVSSTLGREFIKNNLDGLCFLYKEFYQNCILYDQQWLFQQIKILMSFVASVNSTRFKDILFALNLINEIELKKKRRLQILLLTDFIAARLKGN